MENYYIEQVDSGWAIKHKSDGLTICVVVGDIGDLVFLSKAITTYEIFQKIKTL